MKPSNQIDSKSMSEWKSVPFLVYSMNSQGNVSISAREIGALRIKVDEATSFAFPTAGVRFTKSPPTEPAGRRPISSASRILILTIDVLTISIGDECDARKNVSALALFVQTKLINSFVNQVPVIAA